MHKSRLAKKSRQTENTSKQTIQANKEDKQIHQQNLDKQNVDQQRSRQAKHITAIKQTSKIQAKTVNMQKSTHAKLDKQAK